MGGAVGHRGTIAPAGPGYCCCSELRAVVVYHHTWFCFVGPWKNKRSIIRSVITRKISPYRALVIVRFSEVRRWRGSVHFVASVVRHCAVCESSIVTGCIPNHATIQSNGISPDADAIGVCLSRLDRVLEHQRCPSAAWPICRRPIVPPDNQGQLRCIRYNHIFTESGCHWDIVSGIQQVVLNTRCTTDHYAAYRWRRSVNSYCEVACCGTGVPSKIGFPDVKIIRGYVGQCCSVAPAGSGYSCIIKLGGAVVYLHNWSGFVGPRKNKISIIRSAAIIQRSPYRAYIISCYRIICRWCRGVHLVASVARHCIVCESGIVTSRIPDRATI